MVFFIEGDGNTVTNLGGSGGGTLGDWITGTPYPIICTDGTVNTTAVKSAYAVSYWPTIYMVCPDRTLIEAGQSSIPYSLVSCNPAATFSNDPNVMSYSGASIQCNGTLAPVVTIMNNGINNLTSLDVEVDVTGNTTFNTTVSWTGNLSTYQSTNFVLPTITGMQGYEFIMITVSNPNGGIDGDLTNNVTGFTSYPPGLGNPPSQGQITASITQNGNSLTANPANGSPPYIYTWSNGLPSTQTVTPTVGGSYSVVIEDANGCISDPVTRILTISTGVENPNYVNGLNIYPNPSEDVFTITFNSEKAQGYKLSVLNVLGEVIFSDKLDNFFGNYSKQIYLSKYSKAIYFLEIETDEGRVNKKLVLQ